MTGRLARACRRASAAAIILLAGSAGDRWLVGSLIAGRLDSDTAAEVRAGLDRIAAEMRKP